MARIRRPSAKTRSSLARAALSAAAALPAAALVAACSGQRSAGAHGPGDATGARGIAATQPARYYLALGDSLARGMQPDAAGIDTDTNAGYVDQLGALERRRLPTLRVVKLGCGGETTSSFLTGRGNPAALLLGCNPAGGSQMVAAERFLRSHPRRGEVAFVTLDIGANDVLGCLSPGHVNSSCLARALRGVRLRLPVIMRRLRAAAAPGTPMAAMTLYDPFLSEYLSTSPARRSAALQTASDARLVNQALLRLLRAGGFRVARVDQAFRSEELSRTEALPGTGQQEPVAVAEDCRLTWMCARSPVGPDVHANRRGYGVIAAAFASALGAPR